MSVDAIGVTRVDVADYDRSTSKALPDRDRAPAS